MQRSNLRYSVLLPVLAIALAVFVLTLNTGKGETGETDQSYSVSIADQEIPLFFEKEDIDPKLKSTIAEDLKRVLSHVESLHWEEFPQDSWQLRDISITRMLKDWKTDWLPHSIEKKFGAVTTIEGVHHFVIVDELIAEYKVKKETLEKQLEEYRERWELEEDHPDMYVQLDRFVDLLNDRKELVKFLDKPAESDIRIFYPPEDRIGAEELNKLQSDFFKILRSLIKEEYMFRTPSLLDIFYFPDSFWAMGVVEEQDLIEGFVTGAPWEMRSAFVMAWPLIYLEGKWYLTPASS